MKDLRANLLLLALSVAVCCVAYPLALWAFARAAFPTTASGSLLMATAADGTERVVGSSLIAQPFTGDEYFWPRPSAASYNAAAAGGSNWGANNPKLRDRAARQLGPMIRYRTDSGREPRTPQQDMATWAAAEPGRDATDFDAWLQDPANRARAADLEPVPADMVTASGAGLDPHVTLRNALSVYQLDRVAAKRTPPNGDLVKVRDDIAGVVRQQAFTPLSGLVGEPLVNVLELNAELDRRFPAPPTVKAP